MQSVNQRIKAVLPVVFAPLIVSELAVVNEVGNCVELHSSLRSEWRVISSAVERFVHIEDVGSSILSSPTILTKLAKFRIVFL